MKRNLFLTLLAIGFPFFVGIMMFANEQTDVTIRDKLVDIKQVQSEISISQEAAIVSSGSDVNKAKIELAPRIDLYVSTNGKKYAKGTIDDPLKTPQEALNIAQKYKKNSVYIWFRGGTYLLEQTLRFNLADSRTPNAPLIFSGYKDENVTFSGAKPVTSWKKVTDVEIINRLSPEARSHVLVADLKELEIYDYGSPKGGGVELVCNNQMMTLSRWPNHGFTHIAEVSKFGSLYAKESKVGEFYFSDDRPLKWKNEKDIWLHGYWFWDWSDQRQKVKYIDFKDKMISLEKPYHHYGYKKGQGYYALNLLCEIDREGEWYLDREEGKLYFWPPNDKTDNTALTSLPTLVHMIGVENVSFKHINLMNTRSTAVMIEKADNVSVDHAEIRNTGSWGVYIIDSHNSGVRYGHITQTGDGGVYLDGGDRSSLTPGNLYVEQSNIHDYARINHTYKPAISLNGVGNKAVNNTIFNAPHIGIQFLGNEHVIEYNNIYNVLNESNDAGAIYTGRDWTMRGNKIMYNYIHDINGFHGKGANGIYLDDLFSGAYIYGNILENIKSPIYPNNGGGAVHIGGGKDNVVDNNLFINCQGAIHFDARGLGWANKMFSTLNERLENIPYNSSLWLMKYPNVNHLSKENYTAKMSPTGNIVKHNIAINSRWDDYTMFLKNHPIALKQIYDNEIMYKMNSITNEFDILNPPKWWKPIPFKKIGSNP